MSPVSWCEQMGIFADAAPVQIFVPHHVSNCRYSSLILAKLILLLRVSLLVFHRYSVIRCAADPSLTGRNGLGLSYMQLSILTRSCYLIYMVFPSGDFSIQETSDVSVSSTTTYHYASASSNSLIFSTQGLLIHCGDEELYGGPAEDCQDSSQSQLNSTFLLHLKAGSLLFHRHVFQEAAILEVVFHLLLLEEIIDGGMTIQRTEDFQSHRMVILLLRRNG